MLPNVTQIHNLNINTKYVPVRTFIAYLYLSISLSHCAPSKVFLADGTLRNLTLEIEANSVANSTPKNG